MGCLHTISGLLPDVSDLFSIEFAGRHSLKYVYSLCLLMVTSRLSPLGL